VMCRVVIVVITPVFGVRDSAHDGCSQVETPVDAANAAITPMIFDANAAKLASCLLHRLLAYRKLLQALLEGLGVVIRRNVGSRESLRLTESSSFDKR